MSVLLTNHLINDFCPWYGQKLSWNPDPRIKKQITMCAGTILLKKISNFQNERKLSKYWTKLYTRSKCLTVNNFVGKNHNTWPP